MNLLKSLTVTVLAFWLATVFLGSHFSIVGEFQVVNGPDFAFINSLLVFFAVALIFGLVNAIVKPIAKFLAFPLIILTLGLFSLVINAAMILLTAWLTQSTHWGIQVDGFWWAMLAALVIAVISAIGNAILRVEK